MRVRDAQLYLDDEIPAMSNNADTPPPEAAAPVAISHARDWLDARDPGNPRNFPLARRIFSTLAVTFLAFVSTFAASVYSAGIAHVSVAFHVSEEVAILGLSLYNLGLVGRPRSLTRLAYILCIHVYVCAYACIHTNMQVQDGSISR